MKTMAPYERREVVDRIYLALTEAGAKGLTRTQIHGVLSHNHTQATIVAALKQLQHAHKAYFEQHKPEKGRPCEIWYAIRH